MIHKLCMFSSVLCVLCCVVYLLCDVSQSMVSGTNGRIGHSVTSLAEVDQFGADAVVNNPCSVATIVLETL